MDARIERSRAAILQAGMSLLNKNSETSLTDIANTAGVGRATLYRIFETKDQLIRAIAKDALEALVSATEPIESQATSGLDAIRLVFELVMPLSEQLQFLNNLWEIAESDPDIFAIVEAQNVRMSELVDYAKKEGDIDPNLPTVWVVQLIDSMIFAASQMMLKEHYSSEAAAQLVYRTLCEGIRP